MGSPERARSFSELISDPVMGRIVKRAFGSCGNCRKRVLCSSRIIDVRKAVETLKAPISEVDPFVKPGLAASTAAKIFLEKCGKCDRLERCIAYWLSVNEIRDDGITEAIKNLKDNQNLPWVFEIVLREQGLSTQVLVGRVASMWLRCDQGKCYETAVTEQDAT